MTHPVLRKLECFGPLSEEDKDLLLTVVGSEREVPPHTDLISEGDDPAVVHLVTSGLACRYKRLEDGKRQIVAVLVPGDFCDPHTFMLKTIDHSIATIAPSKVAEIRPNTVMDLLARPTLARSICMSAMVDSATMRQWITMIGRRSGEMRIAHLFCELHARLQAVGLASRSSFDLPINQQKLSDAVGLSVVHTNRALKSMREQELVSFKGGKLSILDARRLEQMCGFTPDYLQLA